MRRFVFPLALWLYVSLHHILEGIGGALYYWQRWEMTYIWMVSLIFIGMVVSLVWRDRDQRRLLLAPVPPPGVREIIWNVCLLLFFTYLLAGGWNAVQMWWQDSEADWWYKLAFAGMQVLFWAVAGRWWRDTIKTILEARERAMLVRKGLNR